jgi:phage/plasmid-associated DNA primase
MEFIERLPLRTIYYLASITESDFRRDCINDAIMNNFPKPKEVDMKSWYNQLQQFCKCNIKTKGITKRIYSYSARTPAGLGGRLFCGGSVQGIWGKYRGLLLRDICTDIDMVNAHPVILRYICKLHNIQCPHLEYYINNRDECLALFPNRAVGKTAYLCSTNMDKISRNPNNPQHFKDYDKEMKRIQKELIRKNEYQELYDTVPIEKRESNYNGCAINRILCYYENIILQHAIHIINKNQLEIAVPMFDGAEIYGNHYKNSELLTEITEYVNTEIPDLNMKWAYKEHDMSLSIPDDFDESKPLPTERKFVTSDLQAAEKLYELYPHWKFCNGNLYVFYEGIWVSDDASFRNVISRFTDQLWVGVMNNKTEKMEASNVKSYGNTTDLKTKIIREITSLCIDNDWIKKTERSSLGMLMFQNGYLDLRSGLFYDNSKYPYNPNIVFTYKIPHDWVVQETEDDMKYRKSVAERMFYEPLGKEVGDFFIYNLARGLAGDVMKRIIFGLGYGNTGKSTLSKALLRSCGGYVDTFNANNLAYKQTGQDQAQQNRWIMMKKDKRIILSNEVNSQITLNGNGIKALSSGGDEMEGRGHCEAETTFSIQFLSVVFANDLPAIKPYDDAIDKRLRVVSYEKQYVDRDPENEMELRGDSGIDEEIDTIKFQRAFVRILILQYLDGKDGRFNFDPIAVIAAKKDWIGEEATCLSKFQEDFRITDDENDFIRSSEIEDWLKYKNLGISMKRFGKDMKLHSVQRKYNNVKNGQKKVGGRNVQVWLGIKRIGADDEDETDGETDTV